LQKNKRNRKREKANSLTPLWIQATISKNTCCRKKNKKKRKECKKEMPNFFCLKCLGLRAYRRNADLFQSGIGLVSLGCFARACNGSFCQLDRQGKNGWFHVLLRSQTNILNDDSFFRQLNIVLERGAMKPFSRSSLWKAQKRRMFAMLHSTFLQLSLIGLVERRAN
jgi:hypothetical protein